MRVQVNLISVTRQVQYTNILYSIEVRSQFSLLQFSFRPKRFGVRWPTSITEKFAKVLTKSFQQYER
jgi:hypothetical protein